MERQQADGLRARVKAGMIEHGTERGSRVGMCEFRVDGEAFLLDYAMLCGGRGNYIYPQQELVGDWVDQLLAAGGDIRFGVETTRVEQGEDGATVVARRRERDGSDDRLRGRRLL